MEAAKLNIQPDGVPVCHLYSHKACEGWAASRVEEGWPATFDLMTWSVKGGLVMYAHAHNAEM
jgi:hypothetical protein